MEMTLPPGGLTVTPHPLTLDGQRHIAGALIPGESLLTFLRRHVHDIDSGLWFVTIDGHQVPQAMWARTKPKPGTMVECRSHVHKGVLQIAAMIALSYFTLGAGGLGAGGLFASGGAIGGGFFAAAAVNIVGSVLINKLLGPKPPKAVKPENVSPTYNLQGGRNRSRMYEPIGLLFGEMRISPDFASMPFVMFHGEDQYLYSIFHGGINCGSVSEIRIGRTPLESYAGVSTAAQGFVDMVAQPLQGWGNVDSIAGGQLVGVGSGGDWVTRTSSVDAVTLQIDLEGSLFATSKKDGKYILIEAAIEGEYRALGSFVWLPFFKAGDPYYVAGNTVIIGSTSSKPVRLTYTLPVAQAQYEVRLRKLYADETSGARANSFVWTQLRTVQPDLGQYGGIGRLGLLIKASGQLNGALDEVNLYARAKGMEYWNGSAWVTASTRADGLSNPGAQILRYARGMYDNAGKLIAGIGLADSMIDIESLKGFMVRCAAKGFTFDHYLDSATSHQDVVDQIAAVGMGSSTWQSGKLGVVWAAEDQPVEGVVNMATMKAKSFGVSYQTIETADGLEYTFFDRARDYSWQPVRVTDPTAGTSLNPARISSVGVTDEAHAAVLARFHMAQSIYQRKDITFDTDLEHLTYKRNSVLALTHDVTQWGFGGRVQAAVNNAGFLTLTLDDDVPAGVGSRYIGLRIPGENGYRVFSVAAFVGTSRTVVLTDAWPVGVAVPGATAGNPAHDTIWVYDFKSTPGYKVRVVGIQPSPGMTGATISCVPETGEFWDYVFNGTYAPPPTESLLPYGLPVVSNLAVSEELQRQGATFYTTLTVAYDIAGAFAMAQVWGATADNMLQRLGDTKDRLFSFRAGLDDEWTIEVRPFDALGRAGDAVSIGHTVLGLSVPPDAVTGVALTQKLAFFDRVDDVDFLGYEIRAVPGTVAQWSLGVPVHEGYVTDSPYQFAQALQGLQTVMVSALDTSGNYGLPGYATLDFGFIDELNVADCHDYKVLGWPGEITDATIDGTDLAADLAPAADFWSIGGESLWVRDNIADFWGGDIYLPMEYIAVYAPPYGGGDAILDTSMIGSRVSISWRVDGGTIGDFWAPVSADFWSGYDTFWGAIGAWQPYIGSIESVMNQGIQFRIQIDGGPQQGRISEMSVRLQMPAKEQLFSGINIDAGGTRLAPADGSPVVEWIQVEEAVFTIFADGSGAVAGRLIDFDPNLGPMAEVINAAGSAVTSTGQTVRLSGF